MGTAIGINSMILFAACFEFLGGRQKAFLAGNRLLNALPTAQPSLRCLYSGFRSMRQA